MRTQTVNFQIEYTVMREIGQYESLATMTEKRNCGLHLSTVILHGSFKEELTASRCCIFIFCVVRHRKYFTRICCNTVICSNWKFSQPWFMYYEETKLKKIYNLGLKGLYQMLRSVSWWKLIELWNQWVVQYNDSFDKTARIKKNLIGSKSYCNDLPIHSRLSRLIFDESN